MLSLVWNRQAGGYYQPDYHGKIFTRSEILAIVAARGLPERAGNRACPAIWHRTSRAECGINNPYWLIRQMLRAV
jgi:hypothetical protein